MGDHPSLPQRSRDSRWVLGFLSILGAVLFVRAALSLFDGRATDDPLRSVESKISLGLMLLAGGLLMMTLYRARDSKDLWTTFGWSLVGLVYIAAGFAWKDRNYRRTGLVILGLALVRGFAVDVLRLELFYRMLAFLCLGACLLGVSFLYSKYRDEIRRWL